MYYEQVRTGLIYNSGVSQTSINFGMVFTEQTHRDCIACKLISSGGLIGAGGYVAYNARNFQKIGKIGMMGFSFGLAILGIARLLDLSSFHIPLGSKNKNIR